jgi:hypothetical protein
MSNIPENTPENNKTSVTTVDKYPEMKYSRTSG